MDHGSPVPGLRARVVRPYQFIPGVPAGGHIAGGFWHPGAIDNCPRCHPAAPLTPNPSTRSA